MRIQPQSPFVNTLNELEAAVGLAGAGPLEPTAESVPPLVTSGLDIQNTVMTVGVVAALVLSLAVARMASR